MGVTVQGGLLFVRGARHIYFLEGRINGVPIVDAKKGAGSAPEATDTS